MERTCFKNSYAQFKILIIFFRSWSSGTRRVVGERVSRTAHGRGQPIAVQAGPLVPVREARNEGPGLGYDSMKQALENPSKVNYSKQLKTYKSRIFC